jgi:hypothetical protein
MKVMGFFGALGILKDFSEKTRPSQCAGPFQKKREGSDGGTLPGYRVSSA